MTEELFRHDGYLNSCKAQITAIDETGIRLDKTVFYPLGGGQPGDIGTLVLAGGAHVPIVDTQKIPDATEILHIPDAPMDVEKVGAAVTATIDWERRYRLMRVHTCLHLLSVIITAGVTGGSIRDGSGRLDFDLPESNLDKEHITEELNRLIQENHPVTTEWITDEELKQKPELVKTMSVQPPMGHGQVRLLRIGDIDLQPCGGTHVAKTSEIGQVRVKKIEKKGKHNRRVNIVLES
jgi:misacylated tRNA(Ala) deacylase